MMVAQEGLHNTFYISVKTSGKCLQFFLRFILDVSCAMVVLQCVLGGYREA
jgi:hypothetical protein